MRLILFAMWALVAGGCASESISDLNPWKESAPSGNATSVRIIGFADSRACRLIDRLSVKYRSGEGGELDRAGEALARQQAAAKGGNAILIDAVSYTPAFSAERPAEYSAQGNIYVCPSTGPKSNSQ